MKNAIYIIITLLLISCGGQKRAVMTKTPTQARPSAAVISPTKAFEEEMIAKYPLPKTVNRFIPFEIGSTKEYIDEFSELAQYEMQAFGIPASITLAQAILESGSANGDLAKRTNNHFGIKCHKGWTGDYDFHDDDKKGECFRKYNHPMYSFRDHSIFLASRKRYAFLFDLDPEITKDGPTALKKLVTLLIPNTLKSSST